MNILARISHWLRRRKIRQAPGWSDEEKRRISIHLVNTSSLRRL